MKDELRIKVGNYAEEFKGIGHRLAREGEMASAAHALLVSEMLRSMQVDAVDKGETSRLPFDKPKDEKPARKPRERKGQAGIEDGVAPATRAAVRDTEPPPPPPEAARPANGEARA